MTYTTVLLPMQYLKLVMFLRHPLLPLLDILYIQFVSGIPPPLADMAKNARSQDQMTRNILTQNGLFSLHI